MSRSSLLRRFPSLRFSPCAKRFHFSGPFRTLQIYSIKLKVRTVKITVNFVPCNRTGKRQQTRLHFNTRRLVQPLETVGFSHAERVPGGQDFWPPIQTAPLEWDTRRYARSSQVDEFHSRSVQNAVARNPGGLLARRITLRGRSCFGERYSAMSFPHNPSEFHPRRPKTPLQKHILRKKQNSRPDVIQSLSHSPKKGEFCAPSLVP
jgi:hypothetical protein